MSKNKPRVNIGLPVFNGENYLEEAINSILAQTFTDFELIISDNASTDRTQEICRTYAAKDCRIKYYRNEKNLGAAQNFNRVVELSSGEYFKWAAHDDLITPDFLTRCIEIFDQDPSVVLCYSEPKIIDENGKVVANYDPKLRLNNIGSSKIQDRFADLIIIPHYCFEVFGLIRASTLKKTSLIASHIGSDRNLLVELGLLGRFYQIPENLFFSRDHSEQSIRALSLHSRATWFDPRNKGNRVFPRWKVFFEYFKSVRHMSLSRYERMWCYLHMVNWVRLYGRGLVKDLVVAVLQILENLRRKSTDIDKKRATIT